ncbi:FkbM family methyltransferase [Emticicia sp. CRIBPO]|uniref:FkbM family methyltransferase n=1 Tax=Emticicia sp. CRIBPO TaxID=2683258 RepID=UPI001411FDF2|nr:FkbM family methyltransferase [Emticicia sp. CRIBPO]NBA87933.1 FkbM family methyltransferase [Emticicia sp. CRIBPO]
MSTIKRFIKQNTHNPVFKALAGFGISINRLYENRNHDIMSNGEWTVLKKIAQIHPAVIIDGGANNGEYSLAINDLAPECKVYAFEPVEITYQKLFSVIKDRQNIYPVNKGLYKENCGKEINIYPSYAHSSLYVVKGVSYIAQQKTTIQLVSGDSFLTDHNIEKVDLLKIDIEGAEYDALLGFKQSIASGKIKAIQFEYGYINISTRKLLIDFYEFLESHGYILGKIYPKSVEFRKYELIHEDFIGPNFIAVRKSEKNLIKLLQKP